MSDLRNGQQAQQLAAYLTQVPAPIRDAVVHLIQTEIHSHCMRMGILMALPSLGPGTRFEFEIDFMPGMQITATVVAPKGENVTPRLQVVVTDTRGGG